MSTYRSDRDPMFPHLATFTHRASSYARSSPSPSWKSTASTPPRYVLPESSRHRASSMQPPSRRKPLSYPQDGVVIRAGFSILPPGISRATFRTRFEPSPAHTDPQTDSARLSAQIKDFLKRSDHIEQQWQELNPTKRKYRDRVKTSIAIRSYQLSHSSSLATIDDMDSSFAVQHSDSMSLMDVPNPFDDIEENDLSQQDHKAPSVNGSENSLAIADDLQEDRTNIKRASGQLNLSQLQVSNSWDHSSRYRRGRHLVNELSAELNEEQGTVAVTSEKLESEMNEKQKLEAQLAHVKSRYQNLEMEKHQLELDLAYSISEVNGDATPEDYNEDSVYKQRFERTSREQEILKQRLKQREQDHLDQIMVLKKSLEKKCSDAWEETEEQRQIVAQLKRRIQKLSCELADVRCLLQEEQSRSSLLDKKQRRFDAELSSVNAQLEKEKINKERTIRERDAALIQKDAIYNELQSLKMELHLKESKLASIETELEETSRLGGSSEQMTALRKAKNDLQMRVKDQEEELDDLAGQVQSLEGTKIRLEMQLEQMRKEYKREIQQREEEIEDVRSSAHKKVKALECQLESEHEERTTILRSKQEFERKLFDMEELSASRSVSQEQVTRLKRELKRTRALLKDAQTMVEQSKNDALGKGMLRQLRHQLEDSESQRVRMSRAKQKVEEELADALHQLEDVTRSRSEVENVKNSLLREKSQMQSQFEESEEQLAEVMRKYKASVEQLSLDQNTLTEQSMQISELEIGNASLKETIAELNAKLESLECDQVSQQIQKRFHMKIRELETRLELECTTKGRVEGQVARLKEHIEKFQEDIKNLQTREYLALDKCKKSDRQIREFKEEINRLSQREGEAQSKRSTLEKQLESSDLEISTLKNDLKLAMQRIEDLTAAIKECDDVTDEEDEDSSTESVTSDTEISESFNTPQLQLESGAKSTSTRNRTNSESYA